MTLSGFTPSHGNVSFDEVDPYLAEAAGRLRQTWGADLPVNSAYRSPEYNAKVGGAQNSQHMHGTALDLNMAGMSPEERARLLTAAMDAGFTSFGFYDKHPDMLHVDVREGGRTWGDAPAWAQPIMGQRFKRGMGRVQMAQADTGTMNDAQGITLDAVRAEIARRQQAQQGPTLEQVRAEIARRQSMQGQTPAQPGQPQTDAPIESEPRRSIGQGFVDASRIMANDVAAGFQGINPIKTQQASPVGYIDPATQMLIGEGPQIPRDKLDPRNWVVQVGEDGREYVYARTPEIEDPALASVGRVVGYGTAGGGAALIKGGAAERMAGRVGVSDGVQAARDAVRMDVTPSLGMRGPVMARVAGAGESFAPTSGTIVRDAERAAGEISDAAGRVARTAGSAEGIADAGQALRSGANLFAQRTSEIGGRLYSRVGKFIPNKSRVAMTETSALLGELAGKFADRPNIGRETGASQFAGLLEDARSGLSWDQAAEWRSGILAANRKVVGPFATIPDAQKKRLAQAITADMEAAAKAAGPEAVTAWKRANEFWKARSERIEGALKKVLKSDSDEKAFMDVFAMAGEGSRANAKALADVKRSLKPEEWGEVVSSVIYRMGRATPGAQGAAGETFSPATFLTNWNRISPQAKVIMFEGKGLPAGLRSDLDALARVAERGKDAGRQINTSRSGTNVINAVGFTAAGAADPLATMGVALGSYGAAQLMTARPVVRALTRFYATGSTDALKRIAVGSTPYAGDVSLVLRSLEAQGAGSGQPTAR